MYGTILGIESPKSQMSGPGGPKLTAGPALPTSRFPKIQAEASDSSVSNRSTRTIVTCVVSHLLRLRPLKQLMPNDFVDCQ